MRESLPRWTPYLGTLSLIVLVSACGREPSSEMEGLLDFSDPATIAYAPELDVDVDAMTRTASGLYIRDEAPGEGEAARMGSEVLVHYTGWLPDGSQFDSSVDLGQPYSVPALGSRGVIAGWEEGLQGMRPGGRRLLVIPPDLAYGAAGAGGVIPPNATLVFRVELLEILP